MLADQTLLEVSAKHVARFKEESTAAITVINEQLRSLLRHDIVDLMYRCLVTGDTERRSRCKSLTLEPIPKTPSVAKHLKEIITKLIDEDLTRMLTLATDRLSQLGAIQMQYCCDVFAPDLTGTHRFVVDREIREVFDQLRLQHSLTLQEGTLPSLNAPQVGGGGEGTPTPGSPRQPLAHSLSDFDSPRAAGGSHTDKPLSFRKDPLLASTGTVIPHREHVAALRQSLEREKQLHAKVDGMNKALMDRAAKEKESVEMMQRRMEEAQTNATAEIQSRLIVFEEEIAALHAKHAEQAHRLSATCEVAYVLDTLCGKLNCEVLALRAILTEAGVSSVYHHRLSKASDEHRTTHCCRGRPLVVHSSHWLFGEEPPTREWMKELAIGGRGVAPVACLEEQHSLYAHVVDALAMNEDNKRLRQQVESLQTRLEESLSNHIKDRVQVKNACRHRVANADAQLQKLLEDNFTLRQVAAQQMHDQQAPHHVRRPQSRSTTPRMTPSSDRSGGVVADNHDGNEDDVYLDLCRTRKELREAQCALALLQVKPSGASASTTATSTTEQNRDTEGDVGELPQRAHMSQLTSALRSSRPFSARAPPRVQTPRHVRTSVR